MFPERPREEWEIREDARVLARAEEIKADKKRMSEATQMAKQLADEELKRINGMVKVAGMKTPKQRAETTPAFNNRRGGRNPAVVGRL